MEGKEFWKSKTLWFNALAFGVVLATHFGYGDFQPSPEVPVIAAGVVAVINLVLRLLTDQPVKIALKSDKS